ncbi:MAG: purine-nucleoside phosphorylase [Candidatus Cloacimonetes bacterium]|nr:purine-nucleoside phosphorylase [Candidatus Cloacimonadota bacterium]
MLKDQIAEAFAYIRSKTELQPAMGIVLGTGLNGIVDIVTDPVTINYKEIPHFKVSTAPSHAGRLILGQLSGKTVVFMQGRLHYYEGFTMQEITFPIRVLAALGIKVLFLTNAAGSLNPAMLPGDLVILQDHINFMSANPLIGNNYDSLGERFPSLHEPYNVQLRHQAQSIAEAAGFQLQSGVYAAVAGPSLETRAECRMLRNLGADLVGMSTVPEVIVAIHSGLRVIAVSSVTNLGNIFHRQAHTQKDIRRYAAQSRQKLEKLIKELNLIME